MTDTRVEPASAAAREAWFRQRPVLALAVAAALFVAVLVVRLYAGDPVDAYSMFFVFPVALLAVTFGLRGGAAGGAVAVALTIVWVLLRDVSLTPTGWLSRAAPVLLLGVLLGHATDRIRRAEADRLSLEAAALLHREAIEINDALVQGMVAAKWSIEAGRTEAGLSTLDDTVGQAQALVSELIRKAGMGPSGPVGPSG
jgi:hypothetical protein